MQFSIGTLVTWAALLGSAATVPTHQIPISLDEKNDEEYDLSPDSVFAFSGITTFAQLPSKACLDSESSEIDDILIVGFPFDTATSYRTGTRFGPNAVRQGSRAASLAGHYNYRQSIHPYKQNISIVDCGDFPISPFDNGLAFAQMEKWYADLLGRKPNRGIVGKRSGKRHPQIVAIGGDHSTSLPILRSLHAVHGKMSVIHIDAHIDTWSPKVFAGARGAGSKQAEFADGTPYYWAGMEGLLTNRSVHAGIRSSLDSAKDIDLDEDMGFTIIPASAMLEQGVYGVIERIRQEVPQDGSPVYVSLDVDSLDPAYAPGTAGPAAGGWTTREVIQIVIEALQGLNVNGVDVVEVLPATDIAEITAIAAAELTIEVCRLGALY
ncbi:putative agmatinase 1 [Pseudocercospora fuligena]|uniref:Putative agmatinase 1 n=1 Tax=Pseudocercospora fuligena TaxID=685502 RepID=A0A8H6VS22_9PEZI|nr:putative agmatinase 1 [Pseudocercospora fuligena]